MTFQKRKLKTMQILFVCILLIISLVLNSILRFFCYLTCLKVEKFNKIDKEDKDMNKLNELEDEQIDKTNEKLNSVNLIKSLDEQKSFDEKKII